MFVPGLVVASVCYLQFFPAPSDEKGIVVVASSVLPCMNLNAIASHHI
jgi:hypothetical protein